jgi:hypothetical protein
MLLGRGDVVSACVGDEQPNADADEKSGDNPAEHPDHHWVLLHISSPVLSAPVRSPDVRLQYV